MKEEPLLCGRTKRGLRNNILFIYEISVQIRGPYIIKYRLRIRISPWDLCTQRPNKSGEIESTSVRCLRARTRVRHPPFAYSVSVASLGGEGTSDVGRQVSLPPVRVLPVTYVIKKKSTSFTVGKNGSFLASNVLKRSMGSMLARIVWPCCWTLSYTTRTLFLLLLLLLLRWLLLLLP